MSVSTVDAMEPASAVTFFLDRTELPQLRDPLKLAVIGAGHRSNRIYLPLVQSIRPWIDVVAVCDPVREHADAWAAASGARAFYSVRELVKARPMEAALVVVPIEAHHSLSVFLSTHGVHNHIETTWASMFCQAREMRDAAHRHGVITRVAENFFRTPFDRFAQTVQRSGYLGRIGRVFCYNGHTGYHNNSRWLAFAGTRPRWAQSLTHELRHEPFHSAPRRRHEVETFRARFFEFPNLGVMDMACGHGKGFLGRQARPGHEEWHGSRGTLRLEAVGAKWAEDLRFELRRVSDEQFASAQQLRGDFEHGGRADQVSPVHIQGVAGESVQVWSDTPLGRLERVIPFCPPQAGNPNSPDIHSLMPAMDHLLDFALAVRGVRPSEFTDDDALMSEMMEIAAQESALQNGRRVPLPLEGEVEADAITRRKLREQLGVDPMDVEAMLDLSFTPTR